MKKVLVLFLVFLLIGCGGPNWKNQEPAKSKHLKKDLSLCTRYAWSVTAGNGGRRVAITETCMAEKGWKK
jgi:hypothetical protein